jgi:hypothetical protein
MVGSETGGKLAIVDVESGRVPMKPPQKPTENRN